ncbi:hypothetical protein CA13_63710 [Planctomycetes bacterium CA13]|uniref:YhcG N-terminal domain-containing protein n=1 Tax=Novipirellula herctigrandis TaxID=2527986 RepID=A0A5C5ZCJ1_9BACT|nr:hypothetical protein CA13_63710 [Planctomycetes bacterium CA13]
MQRHAAEKVCRPSRLDRCFLDKIVGALTPQSIDSVKPILEKLSYTHIEQIVDLDDDSKRAFYLTQCVQGNWSVRELKRQITRRRPALHAKGPHACRARSRRHG